MSAATDRLRRFLDETETSQAELARRIGVHRAQVGHLLNERRRPSLEQAAAIERATAAWVRGPIAMREWVRPVERSQVAA